MDRAPLAAGVLLVGLVLTSCGSGSTGRAAGPSATTPPGVTASPAGNGITGPAPGLPTCPTLAQANKALGVIDTGPVRISAAKGGIVCEYTGAGNAGLTISVNQSQAVFAGQVADAGKRPGMRKISGVGDGAFAVNVGGRSTVNAYSDGGRTFVAAQAPGPLGPTEALARIALADN